jgi:histone deacetylase 1/2
MYIHHIGNSVICTPSHDLHLNKILHVPHATKSLISTSRLARDNHAFVEYWPNSFFVKDQDTREVLLQGRCVDGIYDLPSLSTSTLGRHAHGASNSTSSLWHGHLGHPSSVVVHQVLRNNSIPFSESNKESVYDACQMAKSHQLPYPKSTSVSTSPLEVVFSDVCGPASESFGRFKYYLIFIDDYSKFTWIYLLKKKSDVYQKFRDFFRILLSVSLIRKCLQCKLTGEASFKNLTPFSSVWVSPILSLVLMRTSRMVLLSASIDTLLRLVCLCVYAS